MSFLLSSFKFFRNYWLPILWMGLIFFLSSISSYGNEKELVGADKIAHFWEFGILGFLFLRAWSKNHNVSKIWWRVALILGAVYGIGDEIHQIFVPGRDFDLRDWAMDILSAWVGGWFFVKYFLDTRPRLLLHACCANCAAPVIEKLNSAYRLTVIFYNPNISPAREYQKRLADVVKLCRIECLDLIQRPTKGCRFWRGCAPKTLKTAEGGERCQYCFTKRLEEVARQAKAGKYDFWATTLTVGPRKNAKIINQIGRCLGQKYGIMFYEADFKQKGGFARSVLLSKKYGFYRQKYCGCAFSR